MNKHHSFVKFSYFRPKMVIEIRILMARLNIKASLMFLTAAGCSIFAVLQLRMFYRQIWTGYDVMYLVLVCCGANEIIGWISTVVDDMRQQTKFEANLVGDWQPVQRLHVGLSVGRFVGRSRSVANMVISGSSDHETSCDVEQALKRCDDASWKASKHGVITVEARYYERICKPMRRR